MKNKVFLLLFDARMKTSSDRHNYSAFLRKLKGEGFVSLQKSVYMRNFCGSRPLKEETKRIRRFTPESIQVRILELPVKTFAAMGNVNCDLPKLAQDADVICV